MGSVRVKSRPTDFALIIGAMKSGTTTLFDLLAQHPDVAACSEKEPSFFAEDRTEAEWEDYLDLWEWNAEAHKIAVEASTSYAKAPGSRVFLDGSRREASVDSGSSISCATP